MSNDSTSNGGLARLVHWTLLSGVIASAALMILGLVKLLAERQPRTDEVPKISLLVERALAGDGLAVVELGLVVLMLTPVCRVLVLAAGWSLAGKWWLALTSLVVATLLAVSMLLGAG